ncbi:MAG: glycosyltransferase [Chloroflexi bacterium]|nr:glycosyltransferase [Chloroflexota bacterium]
MKILHVYKDYFPVLGGIENHIRTLAEGLAARGHEVSVLVCHTGPHTEVATMNGVRVIRAARARTVASTPLSAELPRLLAQEHPDITHLHFPYPFGEVSHWLRGSGHGPTIITYHSEVVRQKVIGAFYRPVMRWGLRRAKAILATSPNYVVSSPELVRLGSKCLVLPLGIDVERFATPPRTRRERPTLLFVGRHRYYKGLSDLLKVMPEIDADLIVAGDGPMRPGWERLAGELALGEKVRFLGTVPDEALAALYRSADIFVLPASARSEAFGIVLLEAMAAGLPCVTTELGTGTSYVVQDGVTGLVVPARTPPALAEALNRLLADEALRARMGEAGQARARREFRQETMVERVEAVYQSVCGQR